MSAFLNTALKATFDLPRGMVPTQSCFSTSMTCFASRWIGKAAPSSVRSVSMGASVPEVNTTVRAWSAKAVKATAGFRHHTHSVCTWAWA